MREPLDVIEVQTRSTLSIYHGTQNIAMRAVFGWTWNASYRIRRAAWHHSAGRRRDD